jgi:thymidine kinase
MLTVAYAVAGRAAVEQAPAPLSRNPRFLHAFSVICQGTGRTPNGTKPLGIDGACSARGAGGLSPPVGPYPPRIGTVEVITGSMFSGKTEELIRRVKRALFARQRVQAFKPRIDDRYDPSRIVSHEAVAVDAVAVSTSQNLEDRVAHDTQVVAIDEAQFFDRGIVDVCERLANRGVRVIAAGLDQDYLGRPFHPMPDLMAIAEDVTKVHAVCTVCGGTASRSQRLTPESTTVLVGGDEAYEARCRSCFEPRDLPRSQLSG